MCIMKGEPDIIFTLFARGKRSKVEKHIIVSFYSIILLKKNNMWCRLLQACLC